MGSRNISARFRPPNILILALVLATVAAPAVFAEASGVDLLWGTAEGGDLRVTLQLSEEVSEATLVELFDTAGEPVTSEWIDPMGAGRYDLWLTEGLAEVAARGTDYQVTATAASGVLLDTLGLQVALECGGKGLCRFRVRSGIAAPEAIAVRRPFFEALATAREVGGKQPLAWLEKHYPELRGDLFTFGWQTAAVQRLSPGGGGNGDECDCYWVPVVERLNNVCDGPCGASHRIEATARDGSLDFDVLGTTELQVELQCFKSLWGEERGVPVEGAPVQEGQSFEILPCEEECVASVSYLGDLESTLEVSVSAEDNLATATQWAAFSVGSVMLDQGSIQGTASWTPGPLSPPLRVGAQSTPRPPGTPAMMESLGTLDLWVGFIGGPSTAWGKLTSEHVISGIGFASCTASAITEIEVEMSARPPDLDEIDILIGKCDGP